MKSIRDGSRKTDIVYVAATVLVVEYGDADMSFEAGVPGMVRNIRGGNTVNFQSVPQPGLMNTAQGVTVGAVVGGGSQVNGMTFNRGSRSDYDAWEELGNPGWGWESMFKYFKKVRATMPVGLRTRRRPSFAKCVAA